MGILDDLLAIKYFGRRLANLCEFCEIRTIEQLLGMSSREILSQPNFGPRSYRRLVTELRNRGYRGRLLGTDALWAAPG